MKYFKVQKNERDIALFKISATGLKLKGLSSHDDNPVSLDDISRREVLRLKKPLFRRKKEENPTRRADANEFITIDGDRRPVPLASRNEQLVLCDAVHTRAHAYFARTPVWRADR